MISRTKMAHRISTLMLLCILKQIAADFNITDAFAAKCKRYVCNNGYNYDEFFKITDQHRKDDLKFELHFAIKAPKDCHVMMSSIVKPSMSSSIYEIVIGAGGNSYSEIRRMRMKFGKYSQGTIDILSPLIYKAFWIKIYNNGLIKFGKEGEELSLLEFRDPMPLEINYFSFATWTGVEAIILYDCPFGKNISDEIIMEPKKLTVREQLIKDLFTDYDPYVQPITDTDPSIEIGFHAEVIDVKFDISKSTLHTHGFFIAQWNDAKIKWDPKAYGNITHLEFKHKKTWLPEIMIFDSLDISDLLQRDIIISVNNSGTVVLNAKFTTRTHCSPGKRLAHWPKDEHDCALRFGVWSYNKNLKFYVNDDLKKYRKALSEDTKFVGTEWKFNRVSIVSSWTNSTPYGQFYDNTEEDVHNSVNVHINVKRRDSIYTEVYYTPLLVTILVILSTFWTSNSPTGITTILCLNLLFVLYVISQIIETLPVHLNYTPNIVWFYIWIIVSICLRIAIMVAVLAITAEPRPWPTMNDKLKRFLQYSPLSAALGVSGTKVQDDGYNGLLDAADGQKNKSRDNDNDDEWNCLILMIDRILFFIYTIGFSTMFFIQY